MDITACQNKDLKCYNNVQNEPNEIDPKPEKVQSIAESLLSLSNLRAYLMSLIDFIVYIPCEPQKLVLVVGRPFG